MDKKELSEAIEVESTTFKERVDSDPFIELLTPAAKHNSSYHS